jgi:FAD:protein FMN transferase
MTQPYPDKPTFAGARFAHDAMACTFGLYLPGLAVPRAQQIAWAAFDEIDRLEQMLSRFIPHSDIARLNALAPGQSVRVSAETIECLQLAEKVYTETWGAFDIAFRSRKRVGDIHSIPTVPPLVFDPANHAVGVQVAEVALDLGALGKGYAVDRVVALLREWGVQAGLVHSGQSTAHALGGQPDGSPWRVSLRRPDAQTETLGELELRDAALSGSGQLLHGGHIIDPRTGRPAESFAAAWAAAPSAALSDALSTAFMAMTAGEVEGLCGRWPDVSAILLPAGSTERGLLCFGPDKRVFATQP